MTTGETCRTCNRPHGVDGYNPRHPFNGLTSSEPAQDVDVKPVPARWPFDPVLRQALIDKGVLTIDDIRDAEAKILMVTGEFQRAVVDAMKGEDDGS